MSLLHRDARPKRKHRADDRIAALQSTITSLREDIAMLLNQRAAADDYFMRLDQHRKELEVEAEQLTEQLAGERTARIAVEKDRDALERYIRDLEGQLADAERRLDVRTWAEAAAAKTQELPVIEVVPLAQAPFATTNPARVQSWAKGEPAA